MLQQPAETATTTTSSQQKSKQEVAQGKHLAIDRAGVKDNMIRYSTSQGVLIIIADLMVHCPELTTCISHLTLPTGKGESLKALFQHHGSPGTWRKPARASLYLTDGRVRPELWEASCTGTMKEPEPVLEKNPEMLFQTAGSTLR